MRVRRCLILMTAYWSLLLAGFIVTGSEAVADDDGFIEAIRAVEERLGGRLGVAVLDEETGRRWQYHADDRFPLSSTFKTLACAALLARVDAGTDNLRTEVAIEATDLVTYSPVTEENVGNGMSLSGLCSAMMTVSDNTAANLVLESLGGPEALTTFLRAAGDDITRLDRYETALNEATPGDPRDTTTPNAMATTLKNLILGDVLSAKSRRQLTDWLLGNRVADDLLRAGVPEDWRVADRTGAGGHGSRSIAAVMWPPGRKPLVVAIYMTETKATMAERNTAIAGLGAALARFLNE